MRHGVDIARTDVERRTEARVGPCEFVEIGDARVERGAALCEDGRQPVRLRVLDLCEMADDVTDRHEAVLHVVGHLPCEVANGCAPFGITQSRRVRAESAHHGGQDSRERPNLIVTIIREVAGRRLEIDSRGLLGERPQGARDAIGQPVGREQRRGSGQADGCEAPPDYRGAQCVEPGQ